MVRLIQKGQFYSSHVTLRSGWMHERIVSNTFIIVTMPLVQLSYTEGGNKLGPALWAYRVTGIK